MTATEWKKKERVLMAGTSITWKEGGRLHRICVFKNRYGSNEYSLRVKSANLKTEPWNTVTVEWDLSKIRDLLVD